jgi:hypothetical protein
MSPVRVYVLDDFKLTFTREDAMILKCAEILGKTTPAQIKNAPVVKGISRRPPEPEVGVRIPAGVPCACSSVDRAPDS